MNCSSCTPALTALCARTGYGSPMQLLIVSVFTLLITGCAVTAVAGAVVETGATAVKTGAKAGGAVAGGAIDAVDDDGEPEED